jgi:hypothetical protein
LTSFLLTLGAPSLKATETESYTYDALGRLTKVVRSGSVNNSVETTYQLDAADNRQILTVTGSQGQAQVWVVVLPIAGYVVVPLVDPLAN